MVQSTPVLGDTPGRSREQALAATKARLEELQADALAEGYIVSTSSRRDLLTFLSTEHCTCRPFITLLDNGNLRALWKNAEGEQIGLQFRGDQEVQFVLFAKRAGGAFIARASGRDTLGDIRRQIDAYDLARLMTR